MQAFISARAHLCVYSTVVWAAAMERADLVSPVAVSQGGLVSAGAKRVLSLSKGRQRVPLEDLGPALFNRHGLPTCGRHCSELGKRIVEIEGFATFRYNFGYCHEPDPANLLAVSEHGNKMADRDSLLPRLGAKPLKGVFAKPIWSHGVNS